jgi:prepilin-type processing-associated H-X9-DG protein
VICPSQSTPTSYTSERPAPPYPKPLRTSYAANNIKKDWAGATLVPPMRATGSAGILMSEIPEPAQTILITEIRSGQMELWHWSHTDIGAVPPGTISRMEKRHLDGCNFLFADGHAKWLKESQPSMWTSRED